MYLHYLNGRNSNAAFIKFSNVSKFNEQKPIDVCRYYYDIMTIGAGIPLIPVAM